MEESSVLTFHVRVPTGFATVSCSSLLHTGHVQTVSVCQCAMTHFQLFRLFFRLQSAQHQQFFPSLGATAEFGGFLPLLGASAVFSPCWVRRLSVGVTQGDDRVRRWS